MTISAKIILDSIAPSGRRLTTFELTYWRMVHAELMTHRVFSRNAASSRAIPIDKMIERILEDTAGPVWWGKNQKGMQAAEELLIGSPEREAAHAAWLDARDSAIKHARELQALGLHKQIANRVIEPFMHITVIVSATTYTNWFALRDHEMAMPEIAELARKMKVAFDASEPHPCKADEWHLPYVAKNDYHELVTAGFSLLDLVKISVGRCARVSYLTQDGRRDPKEDIALHDRLKAQHPGHWSPFEHAAFARVWDSVESGNFRGWTQYRKMFEHEHVGEILPDNVAGGLFGTVLGIQGRTS